MAPLILLKGIHTLDCSSLTYTTTKQSGTAFSAIIKLKKFQELKSSDCSQAANDLFTVVDFVLRLIRKNRTSEVVSLLCSNFLNIL